MSLAAEDEWCRLERSLQQRYKALQGKWSQNHLILLKATLFELNSIAETPKPSLSALQNSHSPGAALAAILAKLSSASLQTKPEIDARTRASILVLTSRLVWTVHATSPEDVDSSIAETDGLRLAQQILKTDLLQTLSAAMLRQPVSKQPVAEAAECNLMCSSAALLQLACAIARMWPGGILKSAAAGPLAPAATQLAGSVIQELQQQLPGFRNEPVVAGTAVFTLHMVQQLQSIISRPDTPAASMPHLAELQESTGFLLLVILVLHAQLHHYQQQQPHQPVHTSSSMQLQLQQQNSLKRNVEQLVDGHRNSLAELLGNDVLLLWQEQQCWQRYSSAADLCTTLQLLETLLWVWNDNVEDVCMYETAKADASGALNEFVHRMQYEAGDQAVAAATQGLVFVLLQLASCSWRQQQSALSMASVRAAMAAIEVIGYAYQIKGMDWSNEQQQIDLLFRHGFSLIQEVLQKHNSSSSDDQEAAVHNKEKGKVMLLLMQHIVEC